MTTPMTTPMTTSTTHGAGLATWDDLAAADPALAATARALLERTGTVVGNF